MLQLRIFFLLIFFLFFIKITSPNKISSNAISEALRGTTYEQVLKEEELDYLFGDPSTYLIANISKIDTSSYTQLDRFDSDYFYSNFSHKLGSNKAQKEDYNFYMKEFFVKGTSLCKKVNPCEVWIMKSKTSNKSLVYIFSM